MTAKAHTLTMLVKQEHAPGSVGDQDSHKGDRCDSTSAMPRILAPFHGTWEENQDIMDRLREREILPWIKLASLSSPSLNLYSTHVQTGPLSLFIRR